LQTKPRRGLGQHLEVVAEESTEVFRGQRLRLEALDVRAEEGLEGGGAPHQLLQVVNEAEALLV
jgi:hypothetical protein